MATFVVYDEFKFNLGQALFDLDTHTYKLALTNAAPDAAAHDELADVTQIANGFGYTTGGTTMASVVWEETSAGSGIFRWVTADVVFTASGGSIGPFRYGVVYNDTSTGDKLMGYLDYGTAVTVTDGNTFTFDVNASNGWFQLNDV